jgi:hypothetical protein
VVVVYGARQVGKTTLVRRLFPGFDYVVFDPAFDPENARHEPDLFLRNHPAPLVLDEIQYAPEVVAALKRYVDAADARAGQYVVTGSQQWQVMRSVAESLAGRAAFLDLEGFSLLEMENRAAVTPGWLAQWLEAPEDFVAAQGNPGSGPLAERKTSVGLAVAGIPAGRPGPRCRLGTGLLDRLPAYLCRARRPLGWGSE